MNPNMYILLAKRSFQAKAEIVGATPSLSRGEELANELFNRNCLKSSSLVYLSDGQNGERLSVVYKLETLCNHPHIQGEFNFEAPDFPFFACSDCKRVIRAQANPLLVTLRETEKVSA